MIFICNCLNVTIDIGDYSLCDLNTLINHQFDDGRQLRQNVGVVRYIEITKKLPNLVEEKSVNKWKEFRCLNCGLWLYASNEEKMDRKEIVVSRFLLSDAKAINGLLKLESYSPVFNIIIKNSALASYADTGTFEHLHPIAVKWLEEQAAMAEEKIKEFSEKQYEALEQLKARAIRDHEALKRILANRANKKELRPIIRKQPTEEKNNVLKPSSNKPQKKRMDDYDGENIFDLEELDVFNPSDSTDEAVSEVSDSEDADLTQMRRRSDSTTCIARSLPIPVPQFMADRAATDKSNRSPQSPSDIAANIKALAKSVHGDTIFGELPRPRFTTNI